MDPEKLNFPLGFTFDDVLLLPNYCGFSRSDINLTTKLTKNIKLDIPFISAPMDTVTESALAISLSQIGGIGIIHRNLSVQDQAAEVKKVKKIRSKVSGHALLVGAAVGAGDGYKDRVKALVEAGVDVVVVDSAHGFSKPIIEATAYIKKAYPRIEVIAGNIATGDGAKALISAGCDALRVGMGPGAICTTRVISGMGVPQITAIFDVVKVALRHKIPVIADGGIKNSGDMVKALAAGASSVMMGSYFASCFESPGKVVVFSKDQVPSRFKSVFNHKLRTYKFKEYRGMGSEAAMEKGAKIKAEDEFHGKDYYKGKTLVAEGVEGYVPVKGTVKEIIYQALGGIKSGMYYVGAKTIEDLWHNAKFIRITQSSLLESHPHDVLVTNPGKNYA